MTNPIIPAGYIVTDNEAIWGFGPSAEAAWDDMLRVMAEADVTVIDDREYRSIKQQEQDEAATDGGSWSKASDFRILSASAALIELVRTSGGNVYWSNVGGVCCTRDEEEGE